MIYFRDRFLFVHIPRTAGMSVTSAITQSKDPDMNIVCGVDFGPFYRHIQSHKLKDLIPDFYNIKRFCIVRNPFEIVESTYRFATKLGHELNLGMHPHMRETAKKIWLKSLEQTFEEFVLEYFDYLDTGFYAHWCFNWDTKRSLGIRTFEFKELKDKWKDILDILEIDTKIVLPHENKAEIDNANIKWTDDVVNFINLNCELDFKYFGYKRTP